MKVITLLNEKGGVGKTTLATHLSAGLAIKGYRVVLVDTDAQGHATIAFGLDKAPGFYDLIVRKAKFQDVINVVSPERYAVPDDASNISGSLMVIPSNVESRSIANNISDAFVIVKRFYQLQDSVDFVLFDTSPTPSLLHSSIYLATDGIIYPTKCETWSFDGLRESIGHKEQFEPFRANNNLTPIEILGIVPLMYRGQTVEHSENLRILRDNFGNLVWEPIPQRTIWAEAAGAKRTVFSLAPASRAAAEAWTMVETLERHYVST